MKAAFLVTLLSGAIIAAGCEQRSPPPETERGISAKGVDRSHAGKPVPDVELRDSADEPASLADAAGKPLLVNIWATWCAPCVKELPTLDALARSPGAPLVVAVSQDMAPRASVEAFLDTHKIGDVESWHDPKMALSSALDARLLPTTIYYDAGGREVWRYVGDLDWTGPEAARLLAEAPSAAIGGRDEPASRAAAR